MQIENVVNVLNFKHLIQYFLAYVLNFKHFIQYFFLAYVINFKQFIQYFILALIFLFMPPTSKKLEGHIASGMLFDA